IPKVPHSSAKAMLKFPAERTPLRIGNTRFAHASEYPEIQCTNKVRTNYCIVVCRYQSGICSQSGGDVSINPSGEELSSIFPPQVPAIRVPPMLEFGSRAGGIPISGMFIESI